jgi:hypothetical protein
VTWLVGADQVETPRQFFRRHLLRHTATATDLSWYLAQSVPRFSGSGEVRLAVEELVDRLGDFLGFTTTRRDGDDFSRWASPSGHHFAVWTVDGAHCVSAVAAGGGVRDRLLAALTVPSSELLTCVYVVCGDINERRINDGVALRRATEFTRVITIDALAHLAARAGSASIGHEEAVAILKPASVVADAMVSLLSAPKPR